MIYHCYLNGQFILEDEATVSIKDRSYLYGEGLFETLKAVQGRVCFLNFHLERLQRGADVLGIQLPYSPLELEKAIVALLEKNQLQDAYIRLSLSRLHQKFGMQAAAAQSNLLIVMSPLIKVSPDVYTQGVSAVVPDTYRIVPDGLSRLKTTSYLRQIAAMQCALGQGADQAILLNIFGRLAEASTANLFLFDGEKWKTPSLDEGALDGVTRRVVLEVMKANHVPHLEGALAVEELVGAQEAFLTNSIKDVLPLTRLNGKPMGTGSVGAQTQKMMGLYQRRTLSKT